MFMRFRTTAGLAGAALLLAGSAGLAAPGQAGPAGTWRTEKGDAMIRVVDCGGQYWGVVAWEKTPGTDRKNPNPALQSRPTLGMPVLLGMRQDQGDRWSGHIYNAEDGQTYDSHVKLTGPDRLRVEGCVLGIMCGGENWTRTGGATPVAENHHGSRPYTTGTAHARTSIADEPAARVCSRIGRR
jgi:uncharacterized protein (DUF2147 family)